MENKHFHSLSAADRALVAVAVLMDGNDALVYLECDDKNGEKLRLAAQEIAALELALRMPFAGTQLRLALDEITSG
jgi:hypothetical protein